MILPLKIFRSYMMWGIIHFMNFKMALKAWLKKALYSSFVCLLQKTDFNLQKVNLYQATLSQFHADLSGLESERLISHLQFSKCEDRFQFEPLQEQRNLVWKFLSWWSIHKRKFCEKIDFDFSLQKGSFQTILHRRMKVFYK